jgi:hypothetical protein
LAYIDQLEAVVRAVQESERSAAANSALRLATS